MRQEHEMTPGVLVSADNTEDPTTLDVAQAFSDANCRALIAGFVMDCNAVDQAYAAQNLFRNIRLLSINLKTGVAKP